MAKKNKRRLQATDGFKPLNFDLNQSGQLGKNSLTTRFSPTPVNNIGSVGHPSVKEQAISPNQSYQPQFEGGIDVQSLDTDNPQRQFDANGSRGGDFQAVNSPSGEFVAETDENGGGKGDFDYMGSLNAILPGIGAAREAFRSKNFYDDSYRKFDPISFKHGVVADLAKPNFAAPTRVSLGSSLAEHTTGQKFGDVFQRGQEGAYEIQNSEFRQKQRLAANKIGNAETQTNAQLEAEVDRSNSNINAFRGKNAGANSMELLTGAFQNANNTFTQNAAANESQKMLTAEILIKQGKLDEALKLINVTV